MAIPHTCEICSGPGATEPKYAKFRNGDKVVVGYEHRECKQRRAEETTRKRLAAEAKKIERAGQMTML